MIAVFCFVLMVILLNETQFWMNFGRKKRKITKIAKKIHEEKAKAAVLCFHEFQGTERSFDALSDLLFKNGLDVILPRLPDSYENLDEARGKDGMRYFEWDNLAAGLFDELSRNYEKIFVIGFSMGGSLALSLAASRKPSAVITVSAPVRLMGSHFRKRFLRNSQIRLSGILSLLKKEVPTGRLQDEAEKICPLSGYEGLLNTSSVHSQRIGLRKLRRNLKKITSPLFSFHAKGDRTVDFKNLSEIEKRVSSDSFQKSEMDLSSDTLTRRHRIWNHLEVENEVNQKIMEFIMEKMKEK